MTNLGYCRMCAEIKQCFNLIMINKNETNANDDANTNLIYKIFQCFQIKVLAEDNLPKTVCFDCCTQIDHIYEFYQKVQKAQVFLNNTIFNSTTSSDAVNANFQNNYDDFPNSVNDLMNVEAQNSIKFIPKIEIADATSDNTNGVAKKISKKIVRKKTHIWTCNKCQSEFKIRSDLVKHCEDVHGEPLEYKCPKCPKSYTVYSSFTRHLLLHRSKDRFRCFICHKNFTENKTLRKHLKVAHGQDLKKVCTTCGLTFKRAEQLDTHLKKFHKPAQKKVTYECDICKKKVFNLLWHKKTHEAWKAYTWNCEKCQLVFQRNAELVQHCKEIHDEPPEYKCPKCARILTKYRSFIQHLRVHRDKNKFGCNICNKTYSKRYDLKLHMYECHEISPLMKQICPICGKSFKNPRMVQLHTKRYHIDARVEYECDVCHKKLACKASLYTHKKIHDETSKSHVCDQCGFGFRQKCSLKYHIETAHTVINKDNYVACSLCPARFKHKRALQGHIGRIHSDKRFECEICSKKFSLLSRYRDHMRLHTGERPFECEYCKKCFRLKPQLDIHIRQHTGEKPYHCAECNHSFTNNANYIKHKRRKHNMKRDNMMTNQTTRQRNLQRKTKEHNIEEPPTISTPPTIDINEQPDRNSCMQRLLGIYPIAANNMYPKPNNIIYPKPHNMYPNMHGTY